jgi:hypothetical protein
MPANFQPGHQDTSVDYHNDDRAPLLFVSGSEDHIMPSAVRESNCKRYKSNTVTANCRRGSRVGSAARLEVTVTHIGGPTTLVELGRVRLLVDPTFGAPAGDTRSAGDVVAQAGRAFGSVVVARLVRCCFPAGALMWLTPGKPTAL